MQPGIRSLIIDFHPVVGVDWIAEADRMIDEMETAGFEAVITPDWSNGWTRAGSWIREIETTGEFSPMMSGEICCGCGATLSDSSVKSICWLCSQMWNRKHQERFEIGSAVR